MKVIVNDIPRSSKLIQFKLDKGGLTVFCGAGISVTSGIPTVIPLVKKLLQQLNCASDDQQVFLKNDDFPIPFEAIIQEFKETFVFEVNKPFLPEFLRLFNARSNTNHELLAAMFESGLVNSIVTTNFDCCIENLFKDPQTREKKLIVYSEPDEALKNVDVKNKLIKIHGCIEKPSTIGATVDQITKTEFFIKNEVVLNKVLAASETILFLGYSCSDKWDVSRIFAEYERTGGKKPEILFWQHTDAQINRPSDNQKKIFKGYNCTWLTGNTDGLVSELSKINNIAIGKPKYIPPNYVFEKLKPMHEKYVLGNLFRAANLYKQSVRYLEAFLKSGSVDTNDGILITVYETLADIYRKLNQFKKSRANYLYAIEATKRTFKYERKEQAFILAGLNRKLGMLVLANNDRLSANQYMGQALKLVESFKIDDLEIEHKFQLAEIYNDFGYLKHEEKSYDQIEPLWDVSIKLRKQLSQIYPQRYLVGYGESMSNLAAFYYFTNQYPKAIETCLISVGIIRELADVNPTVYLPELAVKLNNLGCMYREILNRKMALKTFKETLRIREHLAKDAPRVYQPKLAFTLINLSVAFQKVPKNKTISLQYLDKAIQLLKRFRRTKAVNKYFEHVAKVLIAWHIDPHLYFKEKWNLSLSQ